MLVRFLLSLLFSLQSLLASIIITEPTPKFDDFSISYFYDKDSRLTIDTLKASDFKSCPNQFTFGYREGSIWFKITIENRSLNKDFILFFTEPFWRSFDFYEPTQSAWIRHKNGLLTPLEERDIEDVNPIFPISLAQGETKSYYIKGQTTNGQLGAFVLYTAKEFYRPSRLSLTTFYEFYTSLLFLIILLNIILLIEMKERIYFYYISYVFSFIVFVSMFSGSYVHLGLDGWNQGLHSIGSVVLAFLALFSKTFLKLETYYPKINRCFKILIVTFVTFAVLIAMNLPHVTLIFNVIAAFFFSLLLVLAIRTWLNGIIKTYYYLFALIIYMPSMALMALTFNGVIDNTDLTRYTFLFGAFIEIIFFSIILASRFHMARFDRFRLQKALLLQKEKNEQFLNQEIARQYQELKEQNLFIIQQSRNAQKGEILSMIAHQWRQPLGAIAASISYLQLKQALGDYDADFFNTQLNDISSSIQALSSTIEDFRSFIQEDQQKVLVKLPAIMESSLALIKPLLESHHITVKTDFQTHDEILSYPNELKQVILNILKNSEETFLEKQTKNACIEISISKKEEKYTITISDNAGGIPEDVLDQIFDAYFTTKKSLNGIGLGLYRSKKIIEERCGGTLIAGNIKGGACFKIQL